MISTRIFALIMANAQTIILAVIHVIARMDLRDEIAKQVLELPMFFILNEQIATIKIFESYFKAISGGSEPRIHDTEARIRYSDRLEILRNS